MRVGLAAILALAVALPFAAAADEMDDWCAQVQKASSIVICSDARLRVETVRRQKLFEALKEQLMPERYKALMAEQNAWVKAYTGRCGVSIDDSPPFLPVSRAVVDCYLRESRSRTAELIQRYSAMLPQELVSGRANLPPTLTPPSLTPPSSPQPSPPPSPPRSTTSTMTDVAIEAWYTCLYDAADTLSQQPEPASVVVEAAFGSCAKYKIAYKESVPGMTWNQAEEIAKTIVSPKVLARVMTVRAARAKLQEEKQRREPQSDYSRM